MNPRDSTPLQNFENLYLFPYEDLLAIPKEHLAWRHPEQGRTLFALLIERIVQVRFDLPQQHLQIAFALLKQDPLLFHYALPESTTRKPLISKGELNILPITTWIKLLHLPRLHAQQIHVEKLFQYVTQITLSNDEQLLSLLTTETLTPQHLYQPELLYVNLSEFGKGAGDALNQRYANLSHTILIPCLQQIFQTPNASPSPLALHFYQWLLTQPKPPEYIQHIFSHFAPSPTTQLLYTTLNYISHPFNLTPEQYLQRLHQPWTQHLQQRRNTTHIPELDILENIVTHLHIRDYYGNSHANHHLQHLLSSEDQRRFRIHYEYPLEDYRPFLKQLVQEGMTPNIFQNIQHRFPQKARSLFDEVWAKHQANTLHNAWNTPLLSNTPKSRF